METLPLLQEEELHFYRTTLHSMVQDAAIEGIPGNDMMRTLRKELTRSAKSDEDSAYFAAVADMYKVVSDSLVSAVHRSGPHKLIDRLKGCKVATDEDEYKMLQDGDRFFGNEDLDTEGIRDRDGKYVGREAEPKQQKREEAKRKRLEEEKLLLKERKVTDEKGNKFQTRGPFPAPRLTVRTSTDTFPSRKALQHRTIIETPSPSSSSSDEEEEVAVNELKQAPASTSAEAVDHLNTFLQPLSIDSLKKMGESAKAKLKASSSHDEYVSQIAKTAARLGCEKACVLMEKQKITEDRNALVQTAPLPAAASLEFLNNLPDHLKRALGSVLGLPDERPSVEDVWERMVAMGFLSVLTNLRPKPLKKMATELGISLPDSNSTEKFCEAVVFAAFPQEKLRAKFSRARQKRVKFTVPQDRMYTRGDMGFISFQVKNVSMFTKETDRHYSPEFVFADLKWSLLCMANKESLALYLCQTGSVYCKFLITVVNRLNPDESICNEGTQCFSAMSQENDWGFNNVMKFSDLLDPLQGFVTADEDTIDIEVGLVLVEPIKAVAPVVREKATPVKGKNTAKPKVDEAAVLQLLQDEKEAQTRKKLKQEVSKTIRDEEKTRKELVQRANKAYHDLCERLRQDTKKAQKEIADREKKEEQEKQRDLEKIKQAEEQHEELKAKLVELKKENADLNAAKQTATQDAKNAKKARDKASSDLDAITEKLSAAQQELKAHEKKLDAATKQFEKMKAAEPDTPSASDDEHELMSEDLARLINQMTDDM